MGNLHLFTIDMQRDFCDRAGALFVPGAEYDVIRTGRLIIRLRDRLQLIHCSLDNHHYMDIAHPPWWTNSNGEVPEPFTIITAEDIEEGRWRPADPQLFDKGLKYVQALEKQGKYPLCIWPPHCVIGTPGSTLAPPIWKAINWWEELKRVSVDYIHKGMNPHTEHYSALKAEFPVPNDPSTWEDFSIQDLVCDSDDTILIAGEASSHCVANTVRDLVAQLEKEDNVSLVLLTDCMSPVKGFEHLQEEFFKEMEAKGITLALSTDI